MSNKSKKHLSLDKRIIISKSINKGLTAKAIADIIGVDETTVSREIKRNRIITFTGATKNENELRCTDCLQFKNCKRKRACGSIICKMQCKGCSDLKVISCPGFTKIHCKLNRYPFVCSICSAYDSCSYTKYKYSAEQADSKYKFTLVDCRKGIDCTPEEFEKINSIVKKGVDNNQSIHHIVKANPENIHVTEKTIYNYINKEILDIKRIDLPSAVSMKKRKKKNNLKGYEYSENKNVDRTGRTYADWLVKKAKDRIITYFQMDFLGAPINSKQTILTLTEPLTHFVLVYAINRPNQDKIVSLFNDIERKIGIENFKKVFSAILTDRDSKFTNFTGIEVDPDTDEVRTEIYYCDPGVSTQKPNVENMNRQLRIIFKKKTTLDNITLEQCLEYSSHLNSRILKSNGDTTPNSLFIRIFGKDIFDKLGLREIDPKDVVLKENR